MKSILQDRESGCLFCGNPNTEEHHVYGGTNRKNSTAYGMMVYLCHAHHNEPPHGVHHNRELNDRLKAWAQVRFERAYPNTNFMEVFGRNYADKESESSDDTVERTAND